MRDNADFLLIGAGIVGLTIARELKRRYRDASVTVIDKEPAPGRHSSGRNSGVLHSGIYYPPESLKAKVCRQGAREMAAFHEEHGLPLLRLGKVLVATSAHDAPQLDLLARRASDQDIVAEEVDEQQLRELEPEARSATGRALWVPTTAVGSPQATLRQIQSELEQMGVDLRFDTAIAGADRTRRQVVLSNGSKIGFGHAVNAAGLHADRIAHMFGAGQSYALLPFKGIYWQLAPDAGLAIRHLIYPVPDLRVPFLGVHTTTAVDGTVYLGPTAVPAFGRENYRGLQDVSWRESIRISAQLMRQFAAGRDGFRRLAWQEGRRYFKPWFVQAARAILPRLRAANLLPTAKVGIRAQMLNRQTGRMVADFLVERASHSTHVLNAISPAWTSAFPFARHICDNYIDGS